MTLKLYTPLSTGTLAVIRERSVTGETYSTELVLILTDSNPWYRCRYLNSGQLAYIHRRELV